MKHCLAICSICVLGMWACTNTHAPTEQNPRRLYEWGKVFSSPEKILAELKAQKQNAHDVYRNCVSNQYDFTVVTRFVRAVYLEPNASYQKKYPKTDWFLERLPLAEFAQVLYYFKEPQHQVFMDVGSGNGDKLYTAMCMNFRQAYGVEYEHKLHEVAVEALKPMTDKKLIDLKEGDATQLSDDYFRQADFLYMYCPLVLNKPEQAKLLLRLLKNMRDNTLIYEAGFLYATEFNALSPTPISNDYRGFLAIKKEKGKYYYRIFVTGWEELELNQAK